MLFFPYCYFNCIKWQDKIMCVAYLILGAASLKSWKVSGIWIVSNTQVMLALAELTNTGISSWQCALGTLQFILSQNNEEHRKYSAGPVSLAVRLATGWRATNHCQTWISREAQLAGKRLCYTLISGFPINSNAKARAFFCCLNCQQFTHGYFGFSSASVC